MINITIVTPVWQRPLLTAIYLRHLTRLVQSARGYGFNLGAVIVGSERGASYGLVQKLTSFNYVEHPNKPLGAKFNKGVEKALERGADYVLIMGSDQFVRPSIFKEYAAAIEAGHEYVGVHDTYIWDPDGGVAIYWPGYTDYREGRVIGPGRLISRKVLESLEGGLYNDEGGIRALDHSADEVLPEPLVITGRPHLFTSIKTANSLNHINTASGAEKVMVENFYEFLV